jgi:leucyl/phenylalanyl-tRNA---protein transferase
MMNKNSTFDNTVGAMPHPLTADKYGFLCNADMADIDMLLMCYRFGIFPWDNQHKQGAFFFPSERYIIHPASINIAKSMRPYFNNKKFTITLDHAFEDVIRLCRDATRPNQTSTWISDQFISSYTALHQKGYAHSLEVWQEGVLVGGLYGVAVGKVFTGESMFGTVSNATKFAMISLAIVLHKLGFILIDCQVYNPFLETFGGMTIPHTHFLAHMRRNYFEEDLVGSWAKVDTNLRWDSL